MKYKMIACDYDQTIYSHQLEQTPDCVIEAIREYIANGGLFVLSTGRMQPAIESRARALGLNSDMICLQGAVCVNIDSGKEVFSFDLTHEDTFAVTSLCDKEGWIVQIYVGTDMCTQKPNPVSERYAKISEITPVYTNIPVSEYVQRNNLRSHKLLIITEPDEAQQKLKQLRAAFPHLDISMSTPTYIEIVDSSSGKGNAVKRLAKLHGIDIEDVACFGDASNDLSMLRVAGLSACPSNAEDEVRASCRYIFEDVALGGAAELILKLARDEL